MRFTVERVHRADARQSMRLAGDIDLAVADELRQALTAALTDTQLSELTVDLTSVTFLDCAGITALLDGRRIAVAQAKRYDAVGARDSVHRVLQITGVLTHLAYPPSAATPSGRTAKPCARTAGTGGRPPGTGRKSLYATRPLGRL